MELWGTDEPSDKKVVKLEFKNLNVDVKDKKILDDVSGCVKPGEVLAVMGPSGSGKTTLLNFLAGRKVGEVMSGEVLLNGRHINKKLKRKICYVLQEDLFFDNLTLKETLTYSAFLRLPDKMPKDEKLKKVDEIIEILDLKKCADTKIGSYISRGISGGEKKRASIGCELITNPSLILLDEPTSGLDSNNAFNLVKILENFAIRNSKTIVMTIHQPSSQIFHLFDKLLLMASGKVAYYGEASDVLEFFEKAGFYCEERFNPADFVLEVISRGAEVEERIVNVYEEWKKDKLTACEDQGGITSTSLREERGETLACEVGQEADMAMTTPSNEALSSHTRHLGISKTTNNASALLPANRPECGFENPAMVDDCNNLPLSDDADRAEQGSTEANSDEAASTHRHLKTTVSTTVLLPTSQPECGLENPVVVVMDDCNNAPLSDGVYRAEQGRSSASNEAEEYGLHLEDGNKWPTSFWTQLFVLTHRTFKQSKSVIMSKFVLIQTITVAIVVGLLWFQLPHKEETIQDRKGLLFFFILYWSVNTLFYALLTFPAERVIIRKERAAGTYRLTAYFFSKSISEAPLVVLQPFIFLMIFYWMSGLNPSVAFLAQTLNVFLCALVAQSFGLAIGASVMTFDKALVVAVVIALTTVILGGFYIDEFPFWLNWLQYFSFIKYSYENALNMEFTGIKNHSCAKVKTNYPSCEHNRTVLTGDDILAEFALKTSYGENCAILLLFFAIMRAIAYCALRFLHKPK